MTRLALGAWFSEPRSLSPWSSPRPSLSSDARAATPMPVAVRPKKCRRVSRAWKSLAGFMVKVSRRHEGVDQFERIDLRIAGNVFRIKSSHAAFKARGDEQGVPV